MRWVQEKRLLAKDDVKSAMTKCGIKFRAADNIQMLLQRIEAELPSIKLDAQASEDEKPAEPAAGGMFSNDSMANAKARAA